MCPRTKLRMMTPEEAARSFPRLLEEDLLVPLLVTGGSMVPFLRHRRDVVYIRGIRYQSPREGDVILFCREGGQALVLHRVLSRYADGSFQVGGDAQTWTEVVRPEQILGVVTWLSRNGGKAFPARRLDQRVLWGLWWVLRPWRPQLLRTCCSTLSLCRLCFRCGLEPGIPEQFGPADPGRPAPGQRLGRGTEAEPPASRRQRADPCQCR